MNFQATLLAWNLFSVVHSLKGLGSGTFGYRSGGTGSGNLGGLRSLGSLGGFIGAGGGSLGTLGLRGFLGRLTVGLGTLLPGSSLGLKSLNRSGSFSSVSGSTYTILPVSLFSTGISLSAAHRRRTLNGVVTTT